MHIQRSDRATVVGGGHDRVSIKVYHFFFIIIGIRSIYWITPLQSVIGILYYTEWRVGRSPVLNS